MLNVVYIICWGYDCPETSTADTPTLLSFYFNRGIITYKACEQMMRSVWWCGLKHRAFLMCNNLQYLGTKVICMFLNLLNIRGQKQVNDHIFRNKHAQKLTNNRDHKTTSNCSKEYVLKAKIGRWKGGSFPCKFKWWLPRSINIRHAHFVKFRLLLIYIPATSEDKEPRWRDKVWSDDRPSPQEETLSKIQVTPSDVSSLWLWWKQSTNNNNPLMSR